ncbi:hypothetical protein FG93_02279 [Bosea sp. LC85]|nr:hypothetical protein FG93_02279 [Bosea sp. LC85]
MSELWSAFLANPFWVTLALILLTAILALAMACAEVIDRAWKRAIGVDQD